MRVKCPSEITAKSKFVLTDDDSFPAAPTISYDDVEFEDTAAPGDEAAPDAAPMEDAAPAENAAPVDDSTSSGYEKRDGPPQQEFAQCGGQDYGGRIDCDQNLSCKEQSPYYSYVSSRI